MASIDYYTSPNMNIRQISHLEDSQNSVIRTGVEDNSSFQLIAQRSQLNQCNSIAQWTQKATFFHVDLEYSAKLAIKKI